MQIVMKPKDTLFFRDGRPFNKGQETEGYHVFPPNPSTVYGALKAIFITENGGLDKFLQGEMRQYIGSVPGKDYSVNPSLKGSFRLKGVFLAGKQENIYFPQPLDLISVNNKLHLLNLKQSVEFKSNIPMETVLWNSMKAKVKNKQGQMIPKSSFFDYLKGVTEDINAVAFEEYAALEPKVGIERNSYTKTSMDSKLYRLNMIRLLEEYSIIAEYEGIKLPQEGLLKLGGQGKACYFKNIQSSLEIDLNNQLKYIKNKIDKTKIFKLYLATPAIFEDGWKPAWIKKTEDGYCIDSRGFVGVSKAFIKAKLLTAAVGRAIYIGGWDMVNNRSKPMRKAVPGGSVYYFKLSEDTRSEEVVEAFWGKNISDYFPEEGYGFSFIGA